MTSRKRICEDIFTSQKCQRLETSKFNENLEAVSNIPTGVDDLPDAMYPLPTLHVTGEDTSHNLTSADEFLNRFFQDYDLTNTVLSSDILPGNTSGDPSLLSEQNQEPTCSMTFQDVSQNTLWPNLCTSEPIGECKKPITDSEKPCETMTDSEKPCQSITECDKLYEPVTECKKYNCKAIFSKQLGDSAFLSLRLHSRQYLVYIHLGACKCVSSNPGIAMDMNTWYEFQNKLFAFNLKYKSSSFIANNLVLVFNYNNCIMRIKSLKNSRIVELNQSELEKLKETVLDFNNKILQHMYSTHLPNLIKSNYILCDLSEKDSLLTFNKLYLYVEECLISILNRIYECSGCIHLHQSRALHTCFMFNNREKLNQLGENVLMLVNLDFVVSSFINKVEFIDEQFLCNINISNIFNELFKSIK